jgi:spermidine/putrescine transport system ATP-binding protein
MNVADNVGYGLRQLSPRPPKSEIQKRVDETLELVQLAEYGKRRIWELSGGQHRPTVLLLDEPLAALDRKLRREMQIELQTLQRDVGITFVLVTHDQEEALSMSDRICIMRDGRIVQSGTPRELYDRPLNRYVADFVGKSNFIPGKIATVNGRSIDIESDGGMLFSCNPSTEQDTYTVGDSASIAVRPELISIGPPGSNAEALGTDVVIPGRIQNRIFLGEHTEYLVSTEKYGEILVLSPKYIESVRGSFERDEDVAIGWKNETALALEDT